MVYKEHHLKEQKLAHILAQYPAGSKILIVFWHGVGDTLMFMPLMSCLSDYYKGKYVFDLGLLPGVGQADYVRYHKLYRAGQVLELPEEKFLEGYDAAFVVSFPMCEGVPGAGTKAEYCCIHEFGLPQLWNEIWTASPIGLVPNRLVGLHLQGTCLPGSTNPDPATAKCLWEDVLSAGGVPIDLHFEHTFHNPENAPFSWATRHCRDLKPDLITLQMMIERCAVVVAVASGPFVMALSTRPETLIYLQKNHSLESYTDTKIGAIISLNEYSADLSFNAPVRQTFRSFVAKLVEEFNLWLMQ